MNDLGQGETVPMKVVDMHFPRLPDGTKTEYDGTKAEVCTGEQQKQTMLLPLLPLNKVASPAEGIKTLCGGMQAWKTGCFYFLMRNVLYF